MWSPSSATSSPRGSASRSSCAVLGELASGAWDLPAFGVEDVTAAGGVIRRYSDQRLGVADASNVILAGRYATRSIVTLDRRHFDVVRPASGGRFRILP